MAGTALDDGAVVVAVEGGDGIYTAVATGVIVVGDVAIGDVVIGDVVIGDVVIGDVVVIVVGGGLNAFLFLQQVTTSS